MQIMTEAYKDLEYFVPLNPAKTEGYWGRPISATERRKIAQEAIKEAGGDMLLGNHLEMGKMLSIGLTRWIGMVDMGGAEIPFSGEVLRMICEYDPDAMAGFLHRLRNIARFGELEDQKN